MKSRQIWWLALCGLALVSTAACGGDEAEGSCTIEELDGQTQIVCPDGSSVAVTDDAGCSVEENDDGSATIACADGTSTTVAGGDFSEDDDCTVADNGDGTATISCPDGTAATFEMADEQANQTNNQTLNSQSNNQTTNNQTSNQTSNQSNNQTAPDGIEIVLSDFEVSVDVDEIFWEVTVANEGSENAAGFWVDFYLDADQAPEPGDEGDDYEWVDGLAAGDSTTLSSSLVAYNGDYSTWVQADADEVNDDLDRANNVAGPAQAQVTEGLDYVENPIQLEISNFEVTVGGGNVLFELDVTNQGPGDIDENEDIFFFVDIFYDRDEAPTDNDEGDIAVYVGDLGNGQTFSVSESVSVSEFSPGDFQAWVNLFVEPINAVEGDVAGPANYSLP